MFGTVQETPYDLNFSVAGIPVRVSVWFWAVGAILGYSAVRMGMEFLLTWMVVLFVSILVHELGHALTARWFGHRPSILLYHFGGLAFYQPFQRDSRWQSILITLAGPGAGFVLYGLTRAFLFWGYPYLPQFPDRFEHIMIFAIIQLLYINLYWGLINLLPVLPLDGGRVAQELFSARNTMRGLITAVRISVVVAGMAAAWFFLQRETYPAMLFAILCANNVSLALQLSGRN